MDGKRWFVGRFNIPKHAAAWEGPCLDGDILKQRWSQTSVSYIKLKSKNKT